MLGKKKIHAIISVLALSAIVIAGTFAWTNFASSIINSFSGAGAGNGSQTEGPGGTLHNDMVADEPFRDVYVENWGTEPLIVRIHLSEYMEIGEGAGQSENNQAVSLIDGATLDDVSSWEPFNGNLDSILRRDGNSTAETFSDFWQWTMGGQKYFIPAPEDLRGTTDTNGVEFVSTTSPFFVDEDTNLENMLQTLNAEVMMMSEWVESGQLGHFWVVDTDGYSYWASPLLPDEATGLLLHKIELVEQPNYDYFYAINIAAHLATIDDVPDNYERMIYDATPYAENLINMLANAIRGDEIPTPTPDITEIPAPDPMPDVTETPSPSPNVTEAPSPTASITPSPTPHPVPGIELGTVVNVDGRGWIISDHQADYMMLISIDFMDDNRHLASYNPHIFSNAVNSWYQNNLQGETIGQYAVRATWDLRPSGQLNETSHVAFVPSREDIIRHDAVLQSLSENIPRQVANRTPAHPNEFAFWTRTLGYSGNHLGVLRPHGNVIFRADDMFASGPLEIGGPSDSHLHPWEGVHYPPPFNNYALYGDAQHIRPAIWVRTEFAAHSR